MSDVTVFLGPTMPADDAARLLPARYLPPAAVGDVYRAVESGTGTVVLVDGYFERVPAVWHKEILFALSRGVAVVGCASMGALRAAELHPYGMIGVGAIFEAFRDGVYTDDDEVAVAHADGASGYRAGSEAMVNIRHGLELALRAGLVSTHTAATLETVAKQQFYADRHWATLVHRGCEEGLPGNELDALLAFVRDARPDLKRADTAKALATIAEHDAAPPDPLPFVFESTQLWRRLTDEESAGPPGRGC